MPVPRDSVPGRGKIGHMSSEVVENDFGVPRRDAYTTKKLILPPGNPEGISLASLGFPIQTLVLVAQNAGSDENTLKANCPYDVSYALSARYVIHQDNTNGNTYQAQYNAGSGWVQALPDFTTAGEADLSYVSDWYTIGQDWKDAGDAHVAIRNMNTSPDFDCDTNYAALQFSVIIIGEESSVDPGITWDFSTDTEPDFSDTTGVADFSSTSVVTAPV